MREPWKAGRAADAGFHLLERLLCFSESLTLGILIPILAEITNTQFKEDKEASYALAEDLFSDINFVNQIWDFLDDGVKAELKRMGYMLKDKE